MATIGFIIDYWGRLQTFIFAMIWPAMFHDHWLTGFAWVGLTAVTWFGSRGSPASAGRRSDRPGDATGVGVVVSGPSVPCSFFAGPRLR